MGPEAHTLQPDVVSTTDCYGRDDRHVKSSHLLPKDMARLRAGLEGRSDVAIVVRATRGGSSFWVPVHTARPRWASLEKAVDRDRCRSGYFREPQVNLEGVA
jgi:hypothetical protein